MSTLSVKDVQHAAACVASSCIRTPVIALRTDISERPLLLKAESLQPVGAFKLRGATNALARLSHAERVAGVVTFSSGNHGQAIAYAAGALGVHACVVMPLGSADVKIAATKRWGAEVVLVPAVCRAEACQEIADRTGARVVPPYDDAHVIAGQGTIGLEILDQVPDVDTVFVPVGGGGLISGIALAIKALGQDVRVIAVEPELAGDLAEGFAVKKRATWSSDQTARTIADGVRTPQVGDLNWDIICEHVDDALTVSDDQILAAVRLIAEGTHLIAEPSGAVATAGYLTHASTHDFGKSVAILSGGNVDLKAYARMLQ